MKVKLLPVVTIASMLLLTGCQSKEASLYKQGMMAIEEADYDNAIILLEKARESENNSKVIARGMGIAHLAKGDSKAAIDDFISAIGYSNGIVDELDIDTSIYLAVAFYKDGQMQEAHNTLDAVIGMRPQNVNAYFLRGKINLINGNEAEAFSDLDMVIKLAPNDYDNYISICEALREYGYDEESNSYIEKAISTSSKLSDYNRGILEYYLGSYTEARNYLENARKKKKGENIALYLGKTYEQLGDSSYAISLYEEALSENPNSGKIYSQLALAQISLKEYQKALDVIERGIAEGNGEAMKEMMFNRVVCCEYLYDFAKAKEYMKQYLELYPDDEKALRENTFLSTR